MTNKEVMQMALDALLAIIDYVPDGDVQADRDVALFEKAEAALREALAHPGHDPDGF